MRIHNQRLQLVAHGAFTRIHGNALFLEPSGDFIHPRKGIINKIILNGFGFIQPMRSGMIARSGYPC